MKRPWIIPLVILALLVAAWTFRWDYGATKTLDSGVVKWKTDRWSGQGWREAYSLKSGQIELPDDQSYYYTNRVLTTCWRVTFGASALWLIYAAWFGPWIQRKRRLID